MTNNEDQKPNTLSNPSLGGTEFKIPIYKDLVSITKEFTNGKFNATDVASIANLHMGLLGTLLDPLGTLIGSALDYLKDWLLAHCKPLADVVNSLMGDPKQITEAAKSWSDAAQNIANSANSFIDSLGEVSSWDSPAAEAYRQSVRQIHSAYEAASGSSSSVAQAITLVGGLVSVTRETLWAILKTFLSEVVKAGIIALASAIPTAGASIGCFCAWFGGRMAVICGKFTKIISKLLTKVSFIMRKLGMSGKSFMRAAQQLKQLSSRMGQAASKAFAKSGQGFKAPKLKFDSTGDLSGWSEFKKTYTKAERYGTAAGDTAVDMYKAGEAPRTIKDLPEGY